MQVKQKKRPQTETVLLATILHHGDSAFAKARQIIPDSSMFYNIYYRKVYQAMLELDDEDKAIDITSVTDHDRALDSHKTYKIMAGGDDYSFDQVFSGTHIETHARMVAEAYIQRMAEDAVKKQEGFDKLNEAIARLEKQGIDRFFDPLQLAANIIETLDHDESILSYPFSLVQRVTNGIYKGQLVVVAGRPSVGKSTFMENVAMDLAEAGRKIVFATAEMSAQALSTRIISRLSMFNLFNKRADLNEDARSKITSATERLTKTGMHIFEFSNTAQLEAMVRERMRDFDLLLVDYLQLIEPKHKYRSLYEKATHVINEVTHLAKKFNLPVMIASQYSRSAARGQPTLGDLRDSGQIEQNADVVISLWVHANEFVNSSKQKVRIDILKNRNGSVMINTDDREFFLWFYKSHFKFYDVSKNDPNSTPPFI